MLQSDLGTVVTYNPLVIQSETSLVALLEQWADANFHHWPVVNDEQQLLGIVSERDLVKAVQELAAINPENTQLGIDELRGRTAGQIMSSQVISISRWDTQTNALFHFLKHRIHSLPVLNEDRLLGLVTTTDFLREFSYGLQGVSRECVSEFVQDDADPIDSDASLEDAAQAMHTANSEHVGVVSGNLPLGAITQRDVRLASCRRDARRLLSADFSLRGPSSVRELAAKSPVIRPGAKLSEAAGLMVEHHRQAIAVVTQAGRMVGVISEATILSAMAGRPLWPVSDRAT